MKRQSWKTYVESTTCYHYPTKNCCSCFQGTAGQSRLWPQSEERLSESKLAPTRRWSWAKLRWTQTPNRKGQNQIGKLRRDGVHCNGL